MDMRRRASLMEDHLKGIADVIQQEIMDRESDVGVSYRRGDMNVDINIDLLNQVFIVTLKKYNLEREPETKRAIRFVCPVSSLELVNPGCEYPEVVLGPETA